MPSASAPRTLRAVASVCNGEAPDASNMRGDVEHVVECEDRGHVTVRAARRGCVVSTVMPSPGPVERHPAVVT